MPNNHQTLRKLATKLATINKLITDVERIRNAEGVVQRVNHYELTQTMGDLQNAATRLDSIIRYENWANRGE